LEIETESLRPGVTLIRLNGNLMMGPESSAMEKLVNQRIDGGDRHLIFDLTELQQLDSTGIGRFIACFNRLLPLNGSMAMAGARPTIRQSFRVTRLDTVFQFCDSKDEAIAKLG
jgi:anti-anti-sigma factor